MAAALQRLNRLMNGGLRTSECKLVQIPDRHLRGRAYSHCPTVEKLAVMARLEEQQAIPVTIMMTMQWECAVLKLFR